MSNATPETEISQDAQASECCDLLMGWKTIDSVPPGVDVLLYEDGDIYKGMLRTWSDNNPEDRSFSAKCGQPVCYAPEPTHWAPLHDEPEAH